MKKLILVLVPAFLLTLSACFPPVKREAVIGTGAGAAIGAIVAADPLSGAVVGGVIGALAGQLVGQSRRTGYCLYRDRDGSLYEKLCPAHRRLVGQSAKRPGYCTYINRHGRTYEARCPL